MFDRLQVKRRRSAGVLVAVFVAVVATFAEVSADPPSAALNQTWSTWYVQRGDVFVLGGTYAQLEANFTQPPYYSPCLAANGTAGGVYAPTVPVNTLVDCPCYPCDVQRSRSDDWEYCQCLGDVTMRSLQLCVAPNSVSLPVSLAERTPLIITVPVAAVKPLRSFAVQLQVSTDVFELAVRYGSRAWSIDSARQNSLVVCLDDDEADATFMKLELTPANGTLQDGERQYEVSVVFNQPLLPVYLFGAALQAHLHCAELSPAVIPVSVTQSVPDAAWLLAAQRARNGELIAAASTPLQPTQVNFYFQLSAFNSSDLHHYPLFDWLPEVNVMSAANYYFDVPLQSCRLVLDTPLTDSSARSRLAQLAPMTSASQFCQFADMLQQDAVDGDQRACRTEVCHFAYALHRCLDLEHDATAPTYATLVDWLLPRLADRLARVSVSVSKRAFNTCSYFFWNRLTAANVTAAAASDDDSTACVASPGTAAWQQDPCCNRTLDACCAARPAAGNVTAWQANSTVIDEQCQTCLSEFIDPLLAVYPNPIDNCTWEPYRITIQNIATDSAAMAVERLRQQQQFCDEALFGHACQSDADCLHPGQFCSPFLHWCAYYCTTDADCRTATSPMSVYHGGACVSNTCTPAVLDGDSGTLQAQAAASIALFGVCKNSVRNGEYYRNPMIDALGQVDAIKIWAIASVNASSVDDVVRQTDDASYPLACYGPGAAAALGSHGDNDDDDDEATCIGYTCNWAPGRACHWALADCLSYCETPASGGSSAYYCQKCVPSARGPRCEEVSTWRGCYARSWSDSDSPFTDELLVPGVDDAAMCAEAGFVWKEDAYNSAETCGSLAARCSAPACGANCTAEACTSSEYGSCVLVTELLGFNRTFSPGVCVFPRQYNTLFGWYCPPAAVALRRDNMAEKPDTNVCVDPLLDDAAACAAAGRQWIDLSSEDKCTAWGICFGGNASADGSNNPLEREACLQCGGQWQSVVRWRRAVWLRGDAAFSWQPRRYAAGQNVYARQLDWDNLIQIYGAAYLTSYIRAFQRDATCWYGRHFPLYTAASCMCNGQLDGQLVTTTMSPSTCLIDWDYPVLWATFPFCTNVTAASPYTAADSPDFFILNTTVVLDPSMRRFCIDLTFSSLVPQSQALVYPGSTTGTIAAALTGGHGSSYMRVFNLNEVEVGMLAGNGIRSLFEPQLRFAGDAQLPICFYDTIEDDADNDADNDGGYPLLTGCADPRSRNDPHVHVVPSRQIVHGMHANTTVCLYMRDELDLYPCRTVPDARHLVYLDNYSGGQIAGLALACAAFIGSALFTVVIFWLLHPPWSWCRGGGGACRLSTSMLLFVLSFLLFAFYAVYFFAIMFGALETESPFENFLNLAPIVLSYNMLSILLTKWLALGLTRSTRREARLPKKVVIPIALSNLLLYVWFILVVVGSAFSRTESVTICQPDVAHAWLYYVSYALRIFLVVLSMIMIVACLVSGVKIYRVLENSVPSRRGLRRLYLFFGLQVCVLFALFGQSTLLLLFFAVPSTLTFWSALLGSVFVSLLPILLLNVLIYYTGRMASNRLHSEKPWSVLVESRTDSAANLLNDQPSLTDRGRDDLDPVADNDNDDDASTSISYITQDDWSVV